jgi:hypothetical protein
VVRAAGGKSIEIAAAAGVGSVGGGARYHQVGLQPARWSHTRKFTTVRSL